MKLNRRRFLTIVAGAGLAASFAPAVTRWRGRAMGAEVRIAIEGGGQGARAALAAARDTIRRMESLFSIYDPASSLSGLNRTGTLRMPVEFARLVERASSAHALSGGLFDPTVQPIFGAYAQSKPVPLPRLIGWDKVEVHRQTIRLPEPGMALTFNGIAQGFATDRVSEVLKAYGFEHVQVNVGEYRVGKAPAQIGIADHKGQLLQSIDVREEAIATSSPFALKLVGDATHILSPDLKVRETRWRTVSAVAETAALADALSTALALAPDAKLAERLVRDGHLRKVFLEDADRSQRWIANV